MKKGGCIIATGFIVASVTGVEARSLSEKRIEPTGPRLGNGQPPRGCVVR